MTEELDVIDDQGAVMSYLKSCGYEEPTEIVVDYQRLLRQFPKLKFVWSEVRKAVYAYNNQLASEKSTGRYSVFLSNYTDNKIDISKLRSTHLNSIVNVDGIVRKVSQSKEMITSSTWRCNLCNNEQESDTAKPPIYCLTCNAKSKIDDSQPKRKKGNFTIVPEKCVYEDVQFISLQETEPENGRQPKNIRCTLRGSMIDTLQAGNRVSITGYVCIDLNEENGLGELWLDVLHCERPDEEIMDLELSKEDKDEIVRMSCDKDIFRKLGESINPAIYGYGEIKMALVLQMFGGVTIEESKTTAERVRGDSHILLCGDPSVAKSQLIRSVSKIVPRCIYTSGKSTSAAGLTVSAVRDESTGQWSLDAGALVLANGSMCVIDELDKMSSDDRSALHEALESQSISVAKAGINQTLKTACPVLCAANPKTGRFIRGMGLAEQVDLPPALLSRFDLIFLMLDEPNEKTDKYVADRIFRTVESAIDGELQRAIPVDMMRKYIKYSKRINPKIPKKVEKYLQDKYLAIRRDMGSNSTSYITVRQLNAIIRLTQSSARVRLSGECTQEDAERAVALFEYAMKGVSLNNSIDSSVFDSKVAGSVTDDMYALAKLIGNMKGYTAKEIMIEAEKSIKVKREHFPYIIDKCLEYGLIRTSNIGCEPTYIVSAKVSPSSGE